MASSGASVSALIADLVFIAIGEIGADWGDLVRDIQVLRDSLGGSVEDPTVIALMVQAGGSKAGTSNLVGTRIPYSTRQLLALD